MGVPNNGWFISWKSPIKTDALWVPWGSLFQSGHLFWLCHPQYFQHKFWWWKMVKKPGVSCTGWWFGTSILFSHILGMSSSQLTFIFFRGVALAHQPAVPLNQSNERRPTDVPGAQCCSLAAQCRSGWGGQGHPGLNNALNNALNGPTGRHQKPDAYRPFLNRPRLFRIDMGFSFHIYGLHWLQTDQKLYFGGKYGDFFINGGFIVEHFPWKWRMTGVPPFH